MVAKNTGKTLPAPAVGPSRHETSDSPVGNPPKVVRGDGDAAPKVKVAKKGEGRDPVTGQILPGYTGNPAGRTRGIRNKITLDRLMLEDKLRTALEKKSPKLLEKAIEMAMEGNHQIMRALLDKLLSTPKHDDPGEAKDNEVKILIQNLTQGTARPEPGVTTVKVTPSQTTVERESDDA